jgi:hypothetical protein
MAHRLDLTPTGFVDDLFIERATLEITRTGDARYSFVATATEGATSIEIWTTKDAQISVRTDDAQCEQGWISIETEGEVLRSLRATDCSVHLEQLDRRHYFLGLYRGADEVRLQLHAPGYIKVRTVQTRGT